MLENPIEWAWRSILHSTFLKAVEESTQEDIDEMTSMAMACDTLPLFQSLLRRYRHDPSRFTEFIGILHTHDENGEPIWEEGKRKKGVKSAYDLLGEDEEQRIEIHDAIGREERHHQREYYRRAQHIDNWELKSAVNHLANSVDRGVGMSAEDELALRRDKFDKWKWNVGDLAEQDQKIIDGLPVSNGYYRAFQHELSIVTNRSLAKGEEKSKKQLEAIAHKNIEDRALRGDRLSNNALERFMRGIRERGLFTEKKPYQDDNYLNMSRDEIMQMASAAVLKLAEDDVRTLVDAHFNKFVKGHDLDEEMDSAVSETIHKDVQEKIKNLVERDKIAARHITRRCPKCSKKPLNQSRGCEDCDHGYITSAQTYTNDYLRDVASERALIDAQQDKIFDQLLEYRIQQYTINNGEAPSEQVKTIMSQNIREQRLMDEEKRNSLANNKVKGRKMRELLLEAYREDSIRRAMVDDLFLDIVSGVKHQLGEEGMTTQELIDSRSLKDESLRHKAKDWLVDVINALNHKGLQARKGTNLSERRLNKFWSIWDRLENEPELKKVILGMQDGYKRPLLGLCILIASDMKQYLDNNNAEENLYIQVAKKIGSESMLAEQQGETDKIITHSDAEQIENYLQFKADTDSTDTNPYNLSLIPIVSAPKLTYFDGNAKRQLEEGGHSTIQDEMEKWAEENEPLSRAEAQVTDITHALYNFDENLKKSTSLGLTQDDIVSIADFKDVLDTLGFESHIPPRQVMQAIAKAGSRREVTSNMMDLYYLLYRDDGSEKSPEEIVASGKLWQKMHDRYYAEVSSDVGGLKGRIPEGMAIGKHTECYNCNGGKGAGGIGNCSNAGQKPGQCFGYYGKDGKPLPANVRGRLRPSSNAPTEYDENLAPFILQLKKRLMGVVTLPDGREIPGSPNNLLQMREVGGSYEPGILKKQLNEWEAILRQNGDVTRCLTCDGSGWFASKPCQDCINTATGKSTGQRPNISNYIVQLNQLKEAQWEFGSSLRDENWGLDDLQSRREVRQKLLRNFANRRIDNISVKDYPELQEDNQEKWAKGIIPKVDGDPHWPYDIHHLLLYPQFHKSDGSHNGRLTLEGLKKLREDAARTPDIRGYLDEALYDLFSGMRDLGNDFINSMLSDEQADDIMETDYIQELLRLLSMPAFNDELVQNHLDLIHAPDGDGRNSLLDPGSWNTQLYCDTCEGTRKQRSIDGHVSHRDCSDCAGTGSEGVRRMKIELVDSGMGPEEVSRILKEGYHNQTLNLTGTRRPSIYSHPDVKHLPSGTGKSPYDILNSQEKGRLFGMSLPSSHSISGIENIFRYDPGHTNQVYVQNLLTRLQVIHELRDQLQEAYGKNKEFPQGKLERAERELERMINLLSEDGTQQQIQERLGKNIDELLPDGVTLGTATDNNYSIPENFDFNKDDVKTIRCPSCTTLAGHGLLPERYYKDGEIKTIQDHMDDDDGWCSAAHDNGLELRTTNAMVRYLRLMLDPDAPEYFKKLSRGVDNLSSFRNELKGHMEDMMGEGESFVSSGIPVSNIRKVNPQMLLLSRAQDVAGIHPDDIPTGRGHDYLGISNPGYSETPTHTLLNTIERHYLPDPVDKHADDRIRRLFAIHVLDPTLGEKYHGDVLSLPIAPEGGWSKGTISELHPEDNFLIEWARKVLGKSGNDYTLDEDEKYEFLGNLYSLTPLLALQKRFSEIIEKSPDLRDEMFPGGATPYIFNFDDGDFLDMTIPSDPELPRGLLHDVFTHLGHTADIDSRLKAYTGNNQTDYMSLFPYEQNPSMEFIMLAPLDPALKMAWITHDDETLAKFGDEWVVTGKSLPEIMESGLLDRMWEHHTGGRDIDTEHPRIGHSAKGTKEDPIPYETVTLKGDSIPRSPDEFFYGDTFAFNNHRQTTDFWHYLVREICLRARHKEESKERLMDASKIGIRSAHNRDGKSPRCELCHGPGHHADIHQAMSDFGEISPHIPFSADGSYLDEDSIPWPHHRESSRGFDVYTPIPKHGVGVGFEQVDTEDPITRQFLVENFSPYGFRGRKGEEVWREAFQHSVEDGLIDAGTDFWRWATTEAKIECLGCKGSSSSHGGTFTLPKEQRDNIERTLLMSTHLANLGLGIINSSEGTGYVPEQAIWEPLGTEEGRVPFNLFSGGAIAPQDSPFFDGQKLASLYNRMSEIEKLLREGEISNEMKGPLLSELELIRHQMDESGPAITDDEKKLLGLDPETGKFLGLTEERDRLSKLTVAQLKQELGGKSLPKGGNKQELVERLYNYQYESYKQIQEDQEEMKREAEINYCEHSNCSGQTSYICPTCYDGGMERKVEKEGDEFHCFYCDENYALEDVLESTKPRRAVYGPTDELIGTDFENLHGHYCERCQPKHLATKDMAERAISVPRDKIFGGYNLLMDILVHRDEDNYITHKEIVDKFGPRCTYAGLSAIKNRDRPGYHYIPLFKDIQIDPETGKKKVGHFTLGDAGLGFLSEHGWGGDEEKAGYHDAQGWDAGGVANGAHFIEADFEHSGGRRNQYTSPSGGKTHCKHCTHPLPEWDDYVTQRVLAAQPELAQRVACKPCSGKGWMYDYIENTDVPCPKCNKGGKVSTRGSVENPALKAAKKAEREELKNLIQCEDCGTKTHKSEKRFYKSRSMGIPYFRGQLKTGEGGELYPKSIHNLNLQSEILKSRLRGLVEEGNDKGIQACGNCATIDTLRANAENPRWQDAYSKRGEESIDQDFSGWARGKQIDLEGRVIDCKGCNGKGHSLKPVHINGRLCEHEPIFTWFRPNFRIIVKGNEQGPDVDVEQFRNSILRRQKKIKLNRRKGLFEEFTPEEGTRAHNKMLSDKAKLDRLLMTDSNKQFTLPVLRPHPGFRSNIGHHNDKYRAHESPFGGLPNVKRIVDYIKDLNKLASTVDNPWSKHQTEFNKLVRRLSQGTPYAGDFGPHKENFGTGEFIGDLFVPSNPLKKLVQIVEKRRDKIKSDSIEDEHGLSDEDMKSLKHMSNFLVYHNNIQDILRGVKETAQQQYEIIPLSDEGFMREDPGATMYTLPVVDAKAMEGRTAPISLLYEDGSINEEVAREVSPAFRILSALDGKDGSGVPAVAITGEKTVADTVSPSFLNVIRNQMQGTSWGWPGSEDRERLKQKIIEGHKETMSQRASYMPRTLAENHKQGTTGLGPVETSFVPESDLIMLDDESRQHHVNNALSVHKPAIDTEGPITHETFLPTETPESSAPPDVNQAEDTEKSLLPLEMAWSNILKNIEIIR